ncbi:prolipoprotein diacylglyceryl transferase [Candidatus Woesearchaeota archaeon]|jgi:phosphatidylglycerol:prolipoprotein diacylglycerol transferase|nr:prolipoprotein diacylglyceryl transferase [Candidatus Woesearchaeota archaeon]
MPFTHNLDPALFTIGGVEIRYYGLVYVIGFVVGFLYLNYLVKSKRLNLTRTELYDLIFYNILGVFIGSRLFHCLVWEPSYYLADPLKILYFWEGGMAYHGGLLGVALATYLFWRRGDIRKRVSLARLGDFASIPAVFALALGRIANYINGELPGTVTNVSWCVNFPRADGCRHPQMIYSAIKRFLVLGWLMFLVNKRYKDGFVLWNMIALFGLGRFFIDFFRDDPRWLGLATGQYLSLIMLVVGVVVLLKYYRRDLKRIFK